jgi:hypothetical protein
MTEKEKRLILLELQRQREQNGFARFEGSAPFLWKLEVGLLDPWIATIRVYNYGGSSGNEAYTLVEDGMLMHEYTEVEHDPNVLLEEAQHGWEVMSFNPVRHNELLG